MGMVLRLEVGDIRRLSRLFRFENPDFTNARALRGMVGVEVVSWFGRRESFMGANEMLVTAVGGLRSRPRPTMRRRRDGMPDDC